MGLFLREHHPLRCWGWLSLLHWIGAVTLSLLLKLPPIKKPWFILWSFYILWLMYVSINLSYSYVWNTFVMSGLVLLVAIWNCWISYKNECAGLLFFHLLPLEPLAHHQNVASLSLFYRYHFGRCSSELVQLIPLPFSSGRSTHYSERLHDFSVTIPRCHKDLYANSFFPRTARLWNSLPIECLLRLIYDLNGFKSRINRHDLTVGSF